MVDIAPGDRFGRYEIRSRLGEGGMGEVFFALDTRLGRPVAIKLLTPELTANKERLHRFEREARLTSGINHPNILTIYEIGKEGSSYYIAAEYVDGCTLRSYLSGNRRRLIEILNIGIQIASALAAAHEAGVVHRDVKPENIMVRRDGYVKVLDFGLAKLAEGVVTTGAGPDASTVTDLDTERGTIVGTILYMSPEQLRGQKVDHRSDFWSLGVTLYEMVAGRLPFDRSTKSDAIASILVREPARLPGSSVATFELQRIIERCLCKERGERYQSADELRQDLSRLQRSLDRSSTMESRPTGSAKTCAETTSEECVETHERAAASPTEEARTARRTLSVETVANIARSPSRAAIAFLLGLLVLGTGSAYVYHSLVRQPVAKLLRAAEFSKLQLVGDVKDAAISPDGGYVAAVVSEGGNQAIWVRQIRTSADLRIALPPGGRYKGLSFSPDGDFIFYLKAEGAAADLYRVPVLGGTPRRLLQGIDTPITFSPDGSRMAFVRQDGEMTELHTADADGAQEKYLAQLKAPQSFKLGGYYSGGPSWSPDGSVIACPAFNVTGRSSADVVAVRVADGSVQPVATPHWRLIEKLVWLSDSTGLVVNARERSDLPLQLWLLSYPDGAARKISNDANHYIGLSASRDSSVLLTLSVVTTSSIWVAPVDARRPARQITPSNYEGLAGIAWSPGGDIVYAAGGTGSHNIWTMAADGGGRRQITFDSQIDSEPSVSPDGRYVVYVSKSDGVPHVWRVGTDGTDARQLTNGGFEDSPSVSPDGHWIIYRRADAENGIWKVPAEGGVPVRVAEGNYFRPSVSPDGALIASIHLDGTAPLLAIVPPEGGRTLKTFDLPAGVDPACPPGVHWSPDGSAVTYVATSGGVSNVWRQSLSGGAPRQVTAFEDGEIFSFAWSPDGSSLACVRGKMATELSVVRNFK